MSKKIKSEQQETPTERLIAEISMKLDKLTKIFSICFPVFQGHDREKIELLDNIGFQPAEIAKLLDRQPNAVTSALSKIRNKGRRRAKRSKSSPQRSHSR